jgi:hypothetical protein
MKPKVSECTWSEFYVTDTINVMHDYDNDYFKVRINNSKPKYFYGEMAYQNSRRFVEDQAGIIAWDWPN